MISYSIDIPSLITVSIYSEAGFINQQTSSYVVIDRSIVSIVDGVYKSTNINIIKRKKNGGHHLVPFFSKWHGVKATLQRSPGLFQSLGRSAWTLEAARKHGNLQKDKVFAGCYIYITID
jgi:hypothetical protein